MVCVESKFYSTQTLRNLRRIEFSTKAREPANRLDSQPFLRILLDFDSLRV